MTEQLKLLLDNFDKIAYSPGGTAKLREMILQLAVQGKLVPQNPKDEPASKLLKKIKAEKEKLIKEGKIRKQKPLPPIKANEISYELPKTWIWMRLPESYFSVPIGRNKIKTKDLQENGKIPVIDQGQKYVAGYTNDISKSIKVHKPVIVFGDHTKAVKFIDFDFVAGADGVKILRPFQIYERYFFVFLDSLKLDNRGYGRHFKILNQTLFALPPLAEQKRIVKKVDELMGLCDELAERIKQASDKNKKLTASTMHHLLGA